MLLFVWHGVLAGQSSSPTPLTRGLSLALFLTCVTGLLGQLLNTLVPRWLTKQEAQPWLLEDLLARRAALRLDETAAAGDLRQINRLIAGQRLLRYWLWPHLLSVALLLALLFLHIGQVLYFRWH